MGRDGILPKPLARTHPRHRTPHVAIATNLVLMVAVATVMIGATSQAGRDAVGATPGPLSAGFYLFAEGLTVSGLRAFHQLLVGRQRHSNHQASFKVSSAGTARSMV